jgi:hypothetical protein
MITHDLYQRLIANLEIASDTTVPMSPEIKACLLEIGSFLNSRSLQFEMLQKQEDASVFLSLCKSNRENLILVFNYFLADRPLIDQTKEVSSEFLKKMLNDFDSAVKKKGE